MKGAFRKRWRSGIILSLTAAWALIACGSRTGLDLPSDVVADDDATTPLPLPDASKPPADSAPPPTPPHDAPLPDAARTDATPDDASPFDATPPEDADAGVDATTPTPPIDASLPPDAMPPVCTTAADQAAYLVSETGNFYAFDPATLLVTKIATLTCPAVDGSSPFTMTVSGQTAYVLYNDGSLYTVDVGSGACQPTTFDATQVGFPGDIGLATCPAGDGGAELCAYGCVTDGFTCSPALAHASFADLVLTGVELVTPTPTLNYPADVKADAYGRMYALDNAGTLAQIDIATARLLGQDDTGVTTGAAAEAVLTWNQQIYLFTAATGDGDSLVSEYDLATTSVVRQGTVADSIVGAGSSVCLH